MKKKQSVKNFDVLSHIATLMLALVSMIQSRRNSTVVPCFYGRGGISAWFVTEGGSNSVRPKWIHHHFEYNRSSQPLDV